MDPFAELTNTERLKPIPGSSKTLHIGLDSKKGSGAHPYRFCPTSSDGFDLRRVTQKFSLDVTVFS